VALLVEKDALMLVGLQLLLQQLQLSEELPGKFTVLSYNTPEGAEALVLKDLRRVCDKAGNDRDCDMFGFIALH